MAEKLRASEATEWNSHGNMGRGKVKKKMTSRTLIKGHAVVASTGLEPGGQADLSEGALEPQPPIAPADPSDG